MSGFFSQLVACLNKNWILFRRHALASAFEIGVAYLLVIILLLARYFIDATLVAEQSSVTNPLNYVIANINATATSSSSTARTLMLYYPDNDYIKSLVTSAYAIITN